MVCPGIIEEGKAPEGASHDAAVDRKHEREIELFYVVLWFCLFQSLTQQMNLRQSRSLSTTLTFVYF